MRDGRRVSSGARGRLARGMMAWLCVAGACHEPPPPSACEEPAEPRRAGLAGRCQEAANAKRPDAAELCLTSFMMTRDPATGGRAARALQRRRGALPIIDWIAGAVGDLPAGADAWLAAGLHRASFVDDDAGALAALQRAAAHRGQRDTLGKLHDAVGLLYHHQRRGAYEQAILAAASAYELADRVCRADDRAVAYLNVASLLYDLGNRSVTEVVLDRARPLAPSTSRYHGYLRKLDGVVKLAQGQPAQAMKALQEARAFAVRDRDDTLEFEVRMGTINAALRRGALDDAAVLLDGSPVPADALPNDRAVHAYHRAWLALARGNPRAAVEIVERALPIAPGWLVFLDDVRGRALAQLGDTAGAERALLRAVEEVERQRDELALDTFRSWWLADMREPFEDLFLLYIELGRLSEALAITQRATARSTLDGLLGDEPPATTGIAAIGERSEAIRKLARALRRSHASVAPSTATVLERLRGHHVITYFRARGELWAITIAADSSLHANRIGDAAAIARRAVALRRAPNDTAIADELGTALLPDGVMPPPGATLYVVADEPITDVSFAALRRRGELVLDHHAVAYASSAAVLSSMRRSTSPIRPLVLGDPSGDLPQAREEAREVAARLQVAPRLGKDATGAAVLGADATLIHIAAHTESTPVGSALRLADGLLDAGAVIDHGIPGGAVVLLTCSSAAISSRDELAPLAAAFVAAGAHTVVASRWAVRDDVGRQFAKVFYQENGVVDPVRAVAAAQRRLAAARVEIGQWATFAVIGGLP